MSLDQNPKSLVLKTPSKLQLEEYELLKALGEGSFGRVYIVRHKTNGQYWAFKQLKKYEIIKSKQVDHLKNEVYILNSLQHPFVVKMAGMTQDKMVLMGSSCHAVSLGRGALFGSRFLPSIIPIRTARPRWFA